MLRAGYVDVALVFRHDADDGGRRRAALPGRAVRPDPPGRTDPLADDLPADDPPTAVADRDDLREQVLLSEPVHLIMPDTAVCGGEPPLAPAVTELWPADLARLSDQRWIAGCDRCREHLLRQCAQAGFTPEDRVHHRRLRRRAGPGHGRPRRRPAAGAGAAGRAQPGREHRPAARNPAVAWSRCATASRPTRPRPRCCSTRSAPPSALPAGRNRSLAGRRPRGAARQAGRRAGGARPAGRPSRGRRRGGLIAPGPARPRPRPASRRPSRCIGRSTK